MSYKICEVTEADFAEVIRSMWHTYENPEQHLFRIFAPVNSTGKIDREAAVEESIQRFWQWLTSDPTSYWQKVVDNSNGDKVVGAALWKIYDKNPYEQPWHHFEAYWHPEGGQRDFATQAFWQHEAVRENLAHRAQLCKSA